MVNNPSQIVINSKKKMIKKKNRYTTKRKERLAKIYIFVKFLLFSCSKSSLFLLPYFIPALILTSVIIPIFCSGSPAILLSYYIFTLISHPKSLAILLSYYVCYHFLFKIFCSFVVLFYAYSSYICSSFFASLCSSFLL